MSILWMTIAAAACEDGKPQEMELRAILDDGELNTLVQSAQLIGPRSVDGGGVDGSIVSAMSSGGAMPPTDAPLGVSGGSPGGFRGPLGFWQFDDCNEFRTQLEDSSFNGNTAFRSVRTTCTEGSVGQGVTLPNSNDIVYVPDQPSFTFTEGVTVAASVKVNKFGGVQTIFRKREGLTSSLALVLNGKQLQFVIDRKGGVPISVSWKGLQEGVFTHVAARYDGSSLQLYVDGKVAVQKSAPGSIAAGEGPLLMGNDGFRRRFDGVLDNVWFANSAAPDDVITGLICQPRGPTLVATPANSGPIPAGTPVTFDLAVTNNNSGTCAEPEFVVSSTSDSADLKIEPRLLSLMVPSGETRHFRVNVMTQVQAEPGERQLLFEARNDTMPAAPATVTATIVIAEPLGCVVRTRRELLIKHLSVVADPVRTTFNQPGNAGAGQWTFKHLMEEMAPTPEAAPDMVEEMFNTWLSPQTVNGFVVPARPTVGPIVLEKWPRTADGKLDLAAPRLQLEAIVNRFDLRNLDQGNAGEGRFVFSVMRRSENAPLNFTIILEYKLPATSLADVKKWADDWHALGALPFPSEEYNTALAALTERLVKRGAGPGRPNGSAISSVRTNEIVLGEAWELREFNLNPATGLLTVAPVDLTPDGSLNNTPMLADWINANQAAINAETHTVPRSFNGSPFQGGAIVNRFNDWRAPGVDPETRRHFALNTCNGCHGRETNTDFLHISPRFTGSEASLSGFVAGALERRNIDLARIVCPATPSSPARPAGARAATFEAHAATEEQLRHGIQRVH